MISILSILLWTAWVHADDAVSHRSVRLDRPSGVSVEVLGRSILYGIQVSRVLDTDWQLSAGFARVAAQDGALTTVGRTGIVPLSVSRYLAREDSAFFASAGLTWVTSPGAVEGSEAILGGSRFGSLPFIPNLGLGYEIRQEEGFLFRAEALLLVAGGFFIATGFSLGYAY